MNARIPRCLIGSPADLPTQHLRGSRGVLVVALLLSCSSVWILWSPSALGRPPAQELSTATSEFIQFESGPVAPLVISADGTRLFLLNTLDHRLEVYRTRGESVSTTGQAIPLSLVYEGAVFTGLEPVSLALHPQDPNRVFVSNHVSDTVSVVDLEKGSVIATLCVGDEPRGLLVGEGKLFVTCSRTPQVEPSPGQIDPGEFDQNVVVVYEASPPYRRLDHVPLEGLKPRDLTLHGDTLYVIPQDSGNHTTLLNETETALMGLRQEDDDVFDGGPLAINPVLLHPEVNSKANGRGWYIPDAGRIVFDWEFPTLVPQLPDNDIFAIDVNSHALLPQTTHGVATTLLAIETNPHTGDLWVLGTDAHNRIRFEPRLEGDIVDNNIVIVEPGGAVKNVLELAPPFLPEEHAQPVAVAFSTMGQPRAYVATLGTGSVLVLDAVDGSPIHRIDCGAIPTGLAVHPTREVLYVYASGPREIRTYDTRNGYREITQRRPLAYDPEPPLAAIGRHHLYEARSQGGHGTGNASCATCHVFGHGDQLAWDLGNPEGSLAYFYPDIMTDVAGFEDDIVALPSSAIASPMKGPMVTQSLRGLFDPQTVDGMPLHWRGDRRFLQMFGGAFETLLGGPGLRSTNMQEFASFLRTLRYAPNPYQQKDRIYEGESAEGADKYGMNPDFEGKEIDEGLGISCITCHKGNFMDRTDFTGSRPTTSAGAFEQMFNTGQLRFSYEKDFRDLSGFGVLHDGAVDGVRGFLDFHKPDNGPPVFPNLNDEDKDQIAAFIRRWDNGLSPMVGVQFTLSKDNLDEMNLFLNLAEPLARGEDPDFDLILKGYRETGEGFLPRGALYRRDDTSGQWGYLFDTGDVADRAVIGLVVETGLAVFTFTCVPPGLGERLGIDRDEDGLLDFQELALRTAPHRADTDRDGYSDGFEVLGGHDPLSPDTDLPDDIPPVLSAIRSLERFASTSTLSFLTDEPALASVEVGSSPGVYDIGPFFGTRREQSHDIVLSGLPAGQELFYRILARDRNGNESDVEGSFRTEPPLFHIEALTLTKSGQGPWVLEARALVHDHRGRPMNDVPILGYWSGDIGGQQWKQSARTNEDGWATFTLSPISPPPGTEIAFSPAYIGSVHESDPYFVGRGGDTPSFFYDQGANKEHYAAIVLP